MSNISIIEVQTISPEELNNGTKQMVLIFVLARKDTPEMDSHVNAIKSSLQYLKQAALHINDCP